MIEAELSLRLQALLTIALTLDGEEAPQLFKFLPEKDRELIEKQAEKYLKLPESDRRTALASKLKALRSEFMFRQITDVHPSHIALVLASEPAPIIRIILHHLPSEMAEEIRKYFPDGAVRKLASCPEPPAVSAEVLEVVKHAFIRQFTFIMPGESLITRLSMTRLRGLLREMSLQTIATAMRRIGREELVDSLQRFPRAHSKEIVRRLKLLRDVAPEDVFTAERCIVWLTAQQLRNFSIIEDTGLLMLAGALLDQSETLQKFLTQKLSIEEAGRFFELIGRLAQADPELTAFARRQLDSAISSLLQARKPSSASGLPA